VIVLYADTSALVGAYVADEPDHETLRALLLEGSSPVVSSELARLEFASATLAAVRAGRLDDHQRLLARFDADSNPSGPLTLLQLVPRTALDGARRLIVEHPLRALDAIHVSVALEHRSTLGPDEELAFITRDRAQAEAARAEGLAVD
jgi:predicted nucleic acid-binding protein